MSGSRKEISRYFTPAGEEMVVYSDGSSATMRSGVVMDFSISPGPYPGEPVMDPLAKPYTYKASELGRIGCSEGWNGPTEVLDPTGLGQHEKGAKMDGGKLRWHLLPLSTIEGVVRIMTFGAEKYTEDGWKDVPQAKERYFSAMMRHWLAIQKGETTDPESGMPHYYHFLCNAVFLTWFLEQDDQKEYDQDDE